MEVICSWLEGDGDVGMTKEDTDAADSSPRDSRSLDLSEPRRC